MEAIAEILQKDPIMTNMQALGLQVQICNSCNTPKEYVVEIMGVKKLVPIMCNCEKEKYEKKKEEVENKERMLQLDKLKKYSLMDDQFQKCTFENWDHTLENGIWYKLGKEYCSNWREMKKQNVGMLLYGPPGTGKSYLSFCIANELLKGFIPVIATSSINLINKIYESYGKYGQEGEVDIINQFKNASLVVIDDLGAEHDGRTGKEKQIIYSLIDTRIRVQKPTIITSNLTPEQLRIKLTGEDRVTRTYDRIVEACPPIEIKGESRRVIKAKEKVNILRGLIS